MKKRRTTTRQQHYSPRAVLAAIGLQMKTMGILQPIQEQVRIKQKCLKYSPVEKLTDLLITILGGAHGISEINTRLRSDQALQRAFGRTGCAEQSVVQETLDACTPSNVAQLMQALNLIFQQQSLASRHDFRTRMLLLDIDMTGLPCGKQQEEATKGYQGQSGIRWGRQLGRVLAAQYEEIVIDRLYPGNLYLIRALQPLMSQYASTNLCTFGARLSVATHLSPC